MSADVAAPAAAQGRPEAERNSWHAAEAYHFWLLTHQQLYAGQAEAALRSALALQRYSDVLEPAAVAAVLALAAYYSGYYGQASKVGCGSLLACGCGLPASLRLLDQQDAAWHCTPLLVPRP
jgi:hypothetical protein